MARRVVVGAVAVLAVATTALVGAGARRPELDTDRMELVGLEVALFLAAVAGILVANGVRDRAGPRGPRGGLGGTTLLIVLGALVAGVLLVGVSLTGADPPSVVRQGGAASQDAVPGGDDDGGGRDGARDARDTGADVVLAVVALTLVVVSVLWARARRRVPERRAAAPEERVRRAATSARERLDTASDARAAVIAAFVTLEDVVADQLGRREPHETQQELVTRALAARGFPASPLRTLADLYRRARWSTGTIGDADVAEAKDALDVIAGGRP